MVTGAERELALLIAGLHGLRQAWEQIPDAEREAERDTLIAWFRETYAQVPRLAALVDPAPGPPFVAVNPAFERLTGMTREQIEGKAFFDLFPDNPGIPSPMAPATFTAR